MTDTAEEVLDTAGLPATEHLTVVCAHPDDETFGLGAIISAFVDAGTAIDLVCLTYGEGSTLGASADLAQRRASELDCAAGVLGIGQVTIHHHPDGALSSVPLEQLAVDRARQLDAMRCHGSQLADNPVPRRRIELQGDREHLRRLHRPITPTA